MPINNMTTEELLKKGYFPKELPPCFFKTKGSDSLILWATRWCFVFKESDPLNSYYVSGKETINEYTVEWHLIN